MDAIPGVGSQGASLLDDGFFEHLREVSGFPVLTRELGEDGSLEGESALKSSKRQTIDPADYEPPSGYRRRAGLQGQ